MITKKGVGTSKIYIYQRQSLEVFLYGIDAWRKTAFDDGIEIIGGSNNTFLAIKFPAKGIDVITTDIALQVQWSCPTILMFWERYLNELVKLRQKTLK